MTIPDAPVRPARQPVLPDALPRALFDAYAGNAGLLYFVGGIWAFLGCLAAAGALYVAFFFPGPPVLRRFLAAIFFFYAALLVAPSIHLLKYRREVLDADLGPGSLALELVLEQQLRFWRFLGVVIVAGLVMGMLAVVGIASA